MIVIPIMLVSARDGSRRQLDSIVIANDGSSLTGPIRSYNVTHYDEHNAVRGRGRVEDWAICQGVPALASVSEGRLAP